MRDDFEGEWTVRDTYPSTPQAPGGPSLTKASLGVGLETKDIVERYHRTGTLEVWNQRQGRYLDVSGVQDLQSALERVYAAQEAFDALPAEVRDHCLNDPVEFVKLMHDPGRRDELVKLGIVPAPVAPKAGGGSTSSEIFEGRRRGSPPVAGEPKAGVETPKALTSLDGKSAD